MATKNIKIVGTEIVDRLFDQTDLTKFKNLESANRVVNPIHCNKLKESFDKFGTAGRTILVIRTSAFDGKPVDYKADGQHSSVSIMQNNQMVDVKIVRLLEDTRQNVVQYIAALNNSGKTWTTQTYLKQYASIGIQEYIIFQAIIKEHKLTVTDLMFIFFGSGVMDAFKSGEMKFPNKEASILKLKALLEVKDILPPFSFARRSFYAVLSEQEDYTNLLAGIKKYGAKFSSNEKEFKEQLNKLSKRNHLKKVA